MTTPTDPAPEPAPASTTEPTPAEPTPVAELVAGIAALRAELDALKAAKPAPVTVPPTDQGMPTITPITLDPLSLPPIARMAAGYRK